MGWNDLSSKENVEAAVRRQGWNVLRTLDPLPAALVEVPVGKELEAIARLEADPAVAYAETDTLAFATGAPAPSTPAAAAGSVEPARSKRNRVSTQRPRLGPAVGAAANQGAGGLGTHHR